MKGNGNFKYQFKYITFNELNDLERRHPLVYQVSSRFSFEHLKNCPDVSNEFPFFFYLIIDNKIVSSFLTFPDRLSIKGKTYPWAWSGSTLTYPSYRGRGLATILNTEALKILHQKGLARSAVFSAEATVHIYKKLGFTIPGYVSRYLMLKSVRPFLEAHFKSKIISHILDLLSRPIIRLIFQYIYGRIKLDTLNVRVNKIPLDNKKYLINSFPGLYYRNKFHFNDSPSKLIWKIKVSNSKDENNCSLYILKEVTQNEPICYFVIRMKHQLKPRGIKYKNFKLMTLMDFGFFKNDIRIYSTLLKKIICFFWKSDAEVLEIISNSKLFGSIMKRMGMIKIGKGISFMFSVPSNWSLDEEWNKLQNWNLTHFSGDAFSF